MFLDEEKFHAVVAHAPLISIDLVIENAAGCILLGLRRNPPARGSWFVPGGRIRKGESLDRAFPRIALDEVGLEISRASAQFLGVYEHFYEDSAVAVNVGTHYLVGVPHEAG